MRSVTLAEEGIVIGETVPAETLSVPNSRKFGQQAILECRIETVIRSNETMIREKNRDSARSRGQVLSSVRTKP